MATSRRFSAHLLIALAITGCKPVTLGLPRIHTSATSPDGQYAATVRNHPTLDPPDQSVWVGLTGGPEQMVQKLAGDQDWCDTIVWAPDSSLVGFLIQDARLLVARPATGQVVFDAWLVDRLGAYPPAFKAVDVAFLPDASGVAFCPCPRSGGDCGTIRTQSLTTPTPARLPASIAKH